MLDVLKIYYLVVLANDDPYDVTPFQGFSLSWRSLHWSLDLVASLPCDVLEASHDHNQIIAQRMGGARSLCWAPLSLRALEHASVDDFGIFVVLFTGEDDCARRVTAWAQKQNRAVLHVSTEKVDGACSSETFDVTALQTYCAAAFKAAPQAFSEEQKKASEDALVNWKQPSTLASGLEAHGHNILKPNYMSLKRAGRSMQKGKSFIGRSEREYTDVILASINAVDRVREEIGLYPVHLMTLIRPTLILAEPALFRSEYRKVKPDGIFEVKAARKILQFIQKQKGLCSTGDPAVFATLHDSPEAQLVLSTRQVELEAFTLGVGLHAAQTTSAVMRLSPGVNHIFPALSAYARSVRSERLEARLKARRLFNSIQTGLRDAVGTARIAHIEEKGGPLKVISDAPIEWLPVGNLPLGLRYDCSRINATPGNLLMSLLLQPVTLVLSPTELQKILVVSSFAADDPLRSVLTGALNAIRHRWAEKAEIIFQSVQTKAEFVDALNAYDGHLLVFDGHGVDNANEPIGKLFIGNETVDVWEFHNKVRIPSIVILSACDTHGIDASSQATVGNGFLFLGARTVLATLLPVGGFASAGFVARLVYRIADFLPAALQAKKRALDWTEVVSGMLRMLLASEILDVLIGPPADTDTPRGKIQLQANLDVNGQNESWFDNLLANIAAQRGDPLETVASKAEAIVSRSEAIRYVQLGNPESILIEDGAVQKRVFEIYDEARAREVRE